MPNQLILATRNSGKIKEIKELLYTLHLEIKSVIEYPNLPDVLEDGATLEANALKKAREIFRLTGIPTLADDTGLEVIHLEMAPGVLSARYAGENVSYEDNNRKLLKELEGIPLKKRDARFRCVVAFVDTGKEKIAEGVCRGKIIQELRGTGGFGYDPLFLPDGYDKTFAELSIEEKNKISHRAKAFLLMKSFLKEYFKNK